MKNIPPHVKLSLPDGSRLTAVAYSQEDYPGINLYLSREGHPSSSALWSSTGNGKLAKTSALACTSRIWITRCITNRTV